LKFNIDLFDQILILAISHDIAKFELLDEARAVVEDEHQCSLLHLMPMLNIRFLCPLSINVYVRTDITTSAFVSLLQSLSCQLIIRLQDTDIPDMSRHA